MPKHILTWFWNLYMSLLVAFLKMTLTSIAGDKFPLTSAVSLPLQSGFYPNHSFVLLKTSNYFEKNLLSLESVGQTDPSINKFAVRNEHMSILNFCLQQLQVYLHAPYKLWQFLFPMKATRDWCTIFTIIEFLSVLHAQMQNLRDSSAKCELWKLTGAIVCPN